MRWEDEAILLGVTQSSPRLLQLDTFTRDHGRTRGALVLEAARPPVLLPGSSIRLTVRFNPADDLAQIESLEVGSGLSSAKPDSRAVIVLKSMKALIEDLLPLREPFQKVYEAFQALVSALAQDDPRWPVAYANSEFSLVDQLGLIRDVRHARQFVRSGEIVYMSKRTGTLVAREKAGAFIDRMLPVPGFLLGGRVADLVHAREALALTGFVFRNFADIDADANAARVDLLDVVASLRSIPRAKIPTKFDLRMAEASGRRAEINARPVVADPVRDRWRDDQTA